MYNSIIKAVRKTISAEKNRFENDTYDLDLTYICERVIAMSFPAEGVESAYRNSIHDVAQMLNEHHFDHYRIYNLSERKYDYNLFNGNVHDWCGFPDHHAPPLALMFKTVISIYNYLQEDPFNVAIVHCLAGKGRTGTTISALMMYAGLFDNREDAMRYFAVKRSSNNFGITGPSQIRYIHYFSDIYHGNQVPNEEPIFLRCITMNTIPKFFMGPMKQGICPVLTIYSATQKGLRIFSSAPDGETKETRTYVAGPAQLVFEVRKVVRGDILVVLSNVTPFYRVEQICRFNFHTGMFQLPNLILYKTDLDGAEGDKRFSNDFHLKLEFERLTTPLPNNQLQMYQKEIKKEKKWINMSSSMANNTNSFRTSSGSKQNKTGSVLFFPTNNAEKIKLAKDVVSKQGTICVRSGYLMKKGHKIKSWRRRWFVLRDGTLSYFKSPKDSAPAGTIPLADIEHLILDDESLAREGYSHIFQIVTVKKIFVIAAENEGDYEEWTEMIQNAKLAVQEAGRLFIEVIDVKYSISDDIDSTGNLTGPVSDRSDIDLITYLTVGMGKKKDVTAQVATKLNPTFQYAGDFVVYDQPQDLVVGFWFRSSMLEVKDTLVAELHIPYTALRNRPLRTDYRRFNRVYTSFLSNLEIRIGTSYKSTDDSSNSNSSNNCTSSNEQQSRSFGGYRSIQPDTQTRKFDNLIGKSRTNSLNQEQCQQRYSHSIITTDLSLSLNSINISNEENNHNNNNNNREDNNNDEEDISMTMTKNQQVILNGMSPDSLFLETIHQQLEDVGDDLDLYDSIESTHIIEEFEKV
ncbi:hypothetical protein SAMD00019534_046530 [Acytostelium subglobosum LB1]|uniref:hypothetical protein n=1 Tax=Acytostelium subglobosum LB1 TaxID=1410327 RepID=UPI000644C5F7|nr:hypothetical protein SAMD00019534_046530 [Acytostelium subglobosum LB1]GAM21478.1 hypothetical protein SAMD00019534_046530 [Acytostelium subglobosum LB1]|eukprot:XP_012755597.1 hypothetical protein SAMD00019534_046530 [Acytostelium subglobosum LB1]